MRTAEELAVKVNALQRHPFEEPIVCVYGCSRFMLPLARAENDGVIVRCPVCHDEQTLDDAQLAHVEEVIVLPAEAWPNEFRDPGANIRSAVNSWDQVTRPDNLDAQRRPQS